MSALVVDGRRVRRVYCSTFGTFGPAPVDLVPAVPVELPGQGEDLGEGWVRVGRELYHRCASRFTAYERVYPVSRRACPNCGEVR